MFDSLFPKEWTTLQRLMWLKTNALARAVYETITGNPVSFTAKAAPLRQLEVAFSPVQDLHGYDAPWPAGGGANKWDEEWEVGGISSADGQNVNQNNIRSKNYTAVQANTEYYFYVATSETYKVYLFFYDSQKSYIGNSSGYIRGAYTIPSGASYVRFQCNTSYGYAGYNHDIAINYPSSVTTYSPYSNLCPISGWDSLNVEQRGKNLWGKQLANNVYVEFDTVTGEQYTVSAKMIDPEAATYLQLAKAPVGTSTWSSMGYVISGKVVTLRTFTAEDGYKYALWSNASYTNVKELQIELGTTATAYVPYNPLSRSISITLGETVYSGWVDVVTGVGEVTMASVDLGTLSWNYRDTNGVFFVSINGRKATAANTDPHLLCEIYKTGGTIGISTTPTTDKTICGRTNSDNIIVRDDSYTDVLTFKTAMSGVQLVYELATPLTIQLTPQEVQSLAGDNTMWTDAASLEVTYRSN